ncbi:hypothetical protein BASA81_000375 [Batrachochytrium salamandrivorans]|nr:hypothetical protein BASA81_000375 [Batrachochytrium salamandrivorans]
MRVDLVRGNLVVMGVKVPSELLDVVPKELQLQQQLRDGNEFHITIAIKRELTAGADRFVGTIVDDLIVLGLGKIGGGENDVYFLVVFSHLLSRIRASVAPSLPEKDFHVTLGFKTADVHGVDKGPRTLMRSGLQGDVGQFIQASFNVLRQARTLEVALTILQCLGSTGPKRRARLLDLICAMELEQGNYNSALSHAFELAEIDECKGMIRKCQALDKLGLALEANFAGLRALSLAEPHSAVECVAVKLLGGLDCPVDSRCVLSSDGPLPANSPWATLDGSAAALAERIHSVFGAQGQHWEYAPLASTTRRMVWENNGRFELPRFFSWVVPQRLCGMSTPRNARDVEAVCLALDVGLVVSLTVESPLPEEWFAKVDCHHAFLPCDNYHPPSLAQVDEFIALAFCAMGKRRAVLVHCGGGKGRAGTMLACWLVRMGGCCDEPSSLFAGMPVCMACSHSPGKFQGFCPHEGCLYSRECMSVLACNPSSSDDDGHAMLSPGEAIDWIRRWRPGSIETREQELFVHEYANELWKRVSRPVCVAPHALSVAPTTAFDASPKWSNSSTELAVEVKGKPKAHGLVVLMGFPGSGKSTLAKLLLAQRKIDMVISGDELGGKQAVEQAVGGAVKSYDRVLVDRCHIDRTTREGLLALAFDPTNAICVFLDLDVDECKLRASSRLDHPVIPYGGGAREVDFFAKRLELPTCAEGFAKVYHVRSKRAWNELLRVEWGIVIAAATPALPVAEEAQPTGRLPGFFKFPRTPHLCKMGETSVTRDDLQVSPSGGGADYFALAAKRGWEVTVEEKVDGANLGISVCPTTFRLLAQNRSHYVTPGEHPQFSPLGEFLSRAGIELRALLDECEQRFPGNQTPILFGEWMVATHSIAYDDLPDYFVAFDLLLGNGRFASRRLFRELMEAFAPSIPQVPEVRPAALTLPALQLYVQTGGSQFRKNRGQLEGVYIRLDQGDFLHERSKIVRQDFIAGNEHWTKHSIQRNVRRF